jgi:nucleotide-binding universal stress UspA family protein
LTRIINDVFSKILAAIDGSESSMDAAYYAIAIVQKDKAELIVLNVHSSLARYALNVLDFGSIKPPFEDDHVNKEIQRSFDRIRGEASKKNVRLRTRVISTEASIVGAIVDYAELEGVELIVVGTRGKLGFKKLLLGSVASGVVTYSYCPVLVVK